MNFSQALDFAFISLAFLLAWLVVNGLTTAAIACWDNTATKPQQLAAPLAYHYACPLTCELPQLETSVPPVALQEEEPIPTPPAPLAPSVTDKKLTLAQEVKARCSKVFGYEITSKAGAKSAIINKGGATFMQAVNLERTGNDFWKAIASHLDRIEAERLERKAAKEFKAA